MSFSVLFVCTGNICRSPMAERLLIARLPVGAPVEVTSAGTMALVGRGIDPPSAQLLRELGGSSDGHAAKRLTVPLVSAADLILTAETAHRAAVVQADPLAFRRTFTMREFGRLGRELPPLPAPVSSEALRTRVAEVSGQRGHVEPAEPDADEIGDPFRAALKIARQRADQVAEAVDAIISALGLTSLAS